MGCEINKETCGKIKNIMEQQKKYDVFISYSRKDFDEVNAFVEMLKQRIPTLEVWMDLDGIEASDEFDEKIITAIDASSYVIFAMSNSSNSVGEGSSKWTKKELVYAKNTGKKVIPLLLNGAVFNSWFLFEFGRVDSIDIQKNKQIEKLVKNLSKWTNKPFVELTKGNLQKTLNADDQAILQEAYKIKERQDKNKRIFKIFANIVVVCVILTSLFLTGRHFYNVKNGIEWEFVVTNDSILPYTVRIVGFKFTNDYNATKLSIPSHIKRNDTTYMVTGIGRFAFSNCDTITSITIPNTIKSIGTGAFDGCAALQSISIPNGVAKIDPCTFMRCSSLTSISMPESVEFIGILAFMDCKSLNHIDLPDSLITIEDLVFNGCSSLKSISIPSKLAHIDEELFDQCDNLENIYVNELNEFYSSIDGALCDKNKTKLICVPKGKKSYTIPSSITNISETAFCFCSRLTSITVEKDSGVYDSRNNCNAVIESATNTLLFGCKNTIIPSDITKIGDNAFWGNGALTNITIPNSVNRIGKYAFYNCDSLSSIVIPSTVQSIEVGAFRGCSSLSSIKVEEGNNVYDSRDNCNALIETATNTLIVGCNNTIIPYSVEHIGEFAFSRCKFEKIMIPDGVRTIGSLAFESCHSLDAISLPSTITSIGRHVFSRCGEIYELNFDGSSQQWEKVQKESLWAGDADIYLINYSCE